MTIDWSVEKDGRRHVVTVEAATGGARSEAAGLTALRDALLDALSRVERCRARVVRAPQPALPWSPAARLAANVPRLLPTAYDVAHAQAAALRGTL